MALEAERAQLESRRQSLDLSAMDREMLAWLVDEFEQVMAEGTNPQKKHLLQRVVKKVLIHDRRTVEVWYGLPNSPSVRTPEYLAPRTQPSSELSHVQSRVSSDPAEPWPTVHDVWYDHAAGLILLRKPYRLPDTRRPRG